MRRHSPPLLANLYDFATRLALPIFGIGCPQGFLDIENE